MSKNYNLITTQLSKNYFRKGHKIKGASKVFKALVDLKEKRYFKNIEKSIFLENFGVDVDTKTLRLRLASARKRILNKKKKELEKLSSKVKRNKIMTCLGFRSKLDFLPKDLEGISYETGLRKKMKNERARFIRFFKRLKLSGCASTWLFKTALSYCRQRVILRNRWVAGRRLKVPFYTSFLRDLRFTCKTFIKTILESGRTPFLPGLLREIYTTLMFKSVTIEKRIFAYKTISATSVYTSFKPRPTIRRRKKINRF